VKGHFEDHKNVQWSQLSPVVLRDEETLRQQCKSMNLRVSVEEQTELNSAEPKGSKLVHDIDLLKDKFLPGFLHLRTSQTFV
jgi:hypothetical protein